jgi:leucyl-tRNA synthetase
MHKKFDHKEIEKKWQKRWAEEGTYKTTDASDKPKAYVLDMFPYPSGDGLHVGHPKGYIATDIYSRYKRMSGHEVLHPMGWDAFGLPAENYAIKNKVHPRIAVEKNVTRFKEQLQLLGLDYDWSREINTTNPGYYKWTQWIFLKLLEKGLAYESHEPINWCPSCQTGLANEDLESDGTCERCGSQVTQRPMRQWVLKITDYADRLLDDLALLPKWPEHIKESQRNWIGRSEGINITYAVDDTDQSLTVFTTRPDTNFGATFVVAAPDSTFVSQNLKRFPNAQEVTTYVEEAKKKSDIERITEGRKKTGVFTGWHAHNPLNGRKLPVYVGDFVLGQVGTGVVVGVPGHDVRDFEFAHAMGIEVVRVVVGPDSDESPITQASQVQEAAGTMIHSDFLNGMDIHTATTAIMDYLEGKGWGTRRVHYKLRDWVFSRQRYWGEPIPVIHCEKDGVVPVPLKDLPVRLPDVEHYEPTGTGESPLAAISEWVNVPCPKCGGSAKRETNTMPQWAGSCWYYLRYIDPKNDAALVDPQKEKYWMPVDLYVGGAEHATRHLIYARFWHKFLYDIGAVSTIEPFTELHSVGLILAEDGRKMSKRWGNVINPDDIVAQNGADTLRVYEMFMGPFENAIAWDTNNLVGAQRFLERTYGLREHVKENETAETKQLLHHTIAKVTRDIESFKFNTAISAMMIFINAAEKDGLSETTYKTFLRLLAPFAPHLTEELWQEAEESFSIHTAAWPEADKSLLAKDSATIAVQINGKARGTILLPVDADEETAKEMALKEKSVVRHLEGTEIRRVVYVPGRVINFILD